MNILQFFHKKETLPPFNIGDKVKLKTDLEEIRLLYNKEYPNCAMTKEQQKAAMDRLRREFHLDGIHTVSKISPGTLAAGGWFVYVDGIDDGYHGNIFELI